MLMYTIILEATFNQADFDIIVNPLVKWPTHNKNFSIVEKAAMNRYMRENKGAFNVKVMRTMVERIDVVA